MKKFIFALLLILLTSQICLAFPTVSPYIYEGRGPGARSAAMGGAYSAVASGIEASYFNPAGVADGSMPFDLSAGGSSNISFSDIFNLYSKLKTQDGRGKYLQDNLSNNLNILGIIDIPVGIAFKNIAISLGNQGLATVQKTPLVFDAANLTIDMRMIGGVGYNSYYSFAYGGSLGFIHSNLNKLFLGANIRGNFGETRLYSYSPFFPANPNIGGYNIWADGTNFYTQAVEGSTLYRNGFGIDIGAKYNFAIPYSKKWKDDMSVSFAVKNIFAGYDQIITRNYRKVDLQNYTVGDVIQTNTETSHALEKSALILGSAYYVSPIDLLIAFDINNYYTQNLVLNSGTLGDEVNVTDFHIGMEKKVNNILYLRAGLSSENIMAMHKDWLTYGLGANLKALSLNVAFGNSSDGTWQTFIEAGIK